MACIIWICERMYQVLCLKGCTATVGIRPTREEVFVCFPAFPSGLYDPGIGHKVHTRLYYVEDSAELRRRVDSELAQIDGVEVLGHSERAPEAIREIRTRQPDVVVLDLQLLEGSGLDVLKGLRNDPWRPIVMV